MKINQNKSGFVEVAILALVVAVMAGGGVTAVASDSARPGDKLYGVDRAVEQVRLAISRSDEGDASLKADMALERLEELQSLADSDAPTERLDDARETYEQQFEDALATAEQARDNGRDVTAVMKRLTENSLRQTAVLEEVATKVPVEAQDGISQAQEATRRGFERASGQISDDEIINIRDQLRVREPKLKIDVPPPRYTDGDSQQTTDTDQSSSDFPSGTDQ